MKTRRMIPMFAASATIAATFVVAQVEPTTDSATTDAATTMSTSRPGVVARFYDVGDLVDLLRSRPIYVADRAGVTQQPEESLGPNAWRGSLDVPDIGMDMVKNFVTTGVDAESWRENGGVVGAIVESLPARLLMVEQTEANHAKLRALLADLRASAAARTMIGTRASWLMLDAKDVRAIYDRARNAAPAPATMGPAIVDDATLDRATVYARGQTTCFNGQTVSIASERERSIVTNVTPIVGAGAVGYSPTTERAKGGVTLQLTPQLSGDDASVVLDLRSVVTETRRPTTDATTTQPAIDPHDVTRQSIGTTVRLPLGQRVLVAGMTMEPSTAGDGRALYLVVEVDTIR